MSTAILDEPDYQWKEAATREGVDYAAVQKSFMDQSYGVVANKAKILFQDPFRLGFEIVHRNEEATKMVGIFAFRVNNDLLYAPTFFVNGEIKPSDMLYRSDVKRFVPLTEDWCAYLVRGVQEQAGEPVDRNRLRQADAYMDRLAYPQRVKYASEMEFDGQDWHRENVRLFQEDFEQRLDDLKAASEEFVKLATMARMSDGTYSSPLWRELVTHCADDSPVRLLLPEVIRENGPEALEKLAAFIDGSPTAELVIAENYTREQLEDVSGWREKRAAAEDNAAIVINLDPRMAKSASARETIFDRGYELVDKRAAESVNTVVEEIGDGFVQELSAPCQADVLLDSGNTARAHLFAHGYGMLHGTGSPIADSSDVDPYNVHRRIERAYFPESNELCCLDYNQPVFGDTIDYAKEDIGVAATELKEGTCYAMVDTESMCISDVFRVEGKRKDGDCTTFELTNHYGGDDELHYAPGRSRSEGRYISDAARFVEVKCDTRTDDGRTQGIDCDCDKVLMNSAGIDAWIRTAGGSTKSTDVTVKPNTDATFDLVHKQAGQVIKVARDLGMLEAHLALAEDFCLSTDKAGEIIDKAVDKEVTYRVYDSITKQAYLTRMEGMEDWVHSYDPEIQVKLDAPQQQILTTQTPQRQRQTGRYGDTYQRVPAKNSDQGEDLLPMDAVLSQSPEQLAQLSQQLDMPHIMDHQCVGQMATASHNIVEQIKTYIPDLESGVDRYFRILFLLRYRPGDFEEIYGKDDLVEFEQDLTELASRSGENLLRMLQRFDPDQYASQEN